MAEEQTLTSSGVAAGALSPFLSVYLPWGVQKLLQGSIYRDVTVFCQSLCLEQYSTFSAG